VQSHANVCITAEFSSFCVLWFRLSVIASVLMAHFSTFFLKGLFMADESHYQTQPNLNGTVSRAGADTDPDQPLPDGFAQKLDTIRQYIANWEKGEICRQHRIGQIINEMRAAPGTYGQNIVGRVAKALGRKKSWLYDCAKVAETYSAQDLRKLLKNQRSRSPGGLTWSHLVELAGISDSKLQRDLEKRLSNERLSVEQLRKEIAPPQRPKESGGAPSSEYEPEEQSIPASTTHQSKGDPHATDTSGNTSNTVATGSISSWLRDMKQSTDTAVSDQNKWRQSPIASLDPAALSESDRQLVEKILANFRKMRDGCNWFIDSLQGGAGDVADASDPQHHQTERGEADSDNASEGGHDRQAA
jgi:hypothetical protein